jgi:parallel beta-helix repeat protein
MRPTSRLLFIACIAIAQGVATSSAAMAESNSSGASLTTALGTTAATTAGGRQRAVCDIRTACQPADYSVTSLANSGHGSLRAAINAANAAGGTTTYVIGFDIASGCSPDGLCLLQPATPLPPITRANVTITGYGQPGPHSTASTPNTNANLSLGDNALIYVTVDGRAYPGKSSLVINAAGATISGLAFIDSAFDAAETGIAVEANGTDASIQGNFIGLAFDNSLGPERNGISVEGASGTVIGGTSAASENVISDNIDGVLACSTTGISVERNLVGPYPDGSEAVINAYAQNTSNLIGVAVDDRVSSSDKCPAGPPSTGAVIGGSGLPTAGSGAGNLISGNGTGVLLDGSATSVQNNFIGTTASGDKVLANGTGVQDSGATDSTTGNLVSGDYTGVEVTGTGDSISNNDFGPTAGGKYLPGELEDGIVAQCLGFGACKAPAAHLQVGAPHDGNLFQYLDDGIALNDCSNCTIQSNSLTHNDGPAIVVHTGAGDLIGGTTPGAGNQIHGNLGPGIELNGASTSTHVESRRNMDWDNTPPGYTPSPADFVLGSQAKNCQAPVAHAHTPNDNLACPTITAEALSGTGADASVSSITGWAPTGATVEVDVASNDPTDGGAGGALRYLGAARASSGTCSPTPCPTGMSGWTVSGPFVAGYQLNRGQPVTAAATLAAPGTNPTEYDTSQYAPNFADLSPADTTVSVTPDMYLKGLPCDTNSAGTFSTSAAMTLRCAITEANLFPNAKVTFDITSGDPGCTNETIHADNARICTITTSTDLPELTASGLTIDGFINHPGGATPNTNAFGLPDNSVHTIVLTTALLVAGQNETIRGLDIVGITTSTSTVGGAISFDGEASRGAKIYGNFIGVDADGTTADHNFEAIGAPPFLGSLGGTKNAAIGGASPQNRNVIDDPIFIDGDAGDVVLGNYIGTDATGTVALAQSAYIGIQAGGDNIVIGKPVAGGGNVISGWTAGIIDQTNTSGGANHNTFQNNRVGTNAAGDAAIPNETGIVIGGNVVGSATVANNLVSGNTLDAIEIVGPPEIVNPNFPFVSVTGNTIGLSGSGAPLPNGGVGISIQGVQDPWGSDILPNQFTLASKNIIEDNGGAGILVGGSSTDNSQAVLSQNTVNDNGAAGIDLSGEGSCLSSYAPGTAPNDYTPCPSALSLTGTAGNATLSGTTCPGCLVEAFIAVPGGADGSNGGSSTYLGSVTAGICSAAPCSGNSTAFSIANLNVPLGDEVTTTATQQTTPGTAMPLETSEFSDDVGF